MSLIDHAKELFATRREVFRPGEISINHGPMRLVDLVVTQERTIPVIGKWRMVNSRLVEVELEAEIVKAELGSTPKMLYAPKVGH